MTMTVQQHHRAAPLSDQLHAAIKDNPLAASLIGSGIALMLFGGGKGLSAAAGLIGQAAQRSGSAASNVFDEAQQKIQNDVQDETQGDRGDDGATLSSKVSDSLTRQPLLLGTIGLAVGAGLAAAFVPGIVRKG
jgi:hypothetical protein